MSILTLPKTFDEVQGASLLPKDWYVLKIVKDPKVEPNANKKAADQGQDYDAQKVGYNYTLHLRIEHADPLVNGRSFTRWLSLPTEMDKTRIMPNGQTLEDWKMEAIRKEAEAFHGGEKISGSEVSFEVGMKAAYFITDEVDRRTGELVNVIDLNVAPKPVLV